LTFDSQFPISGHPEEVSRRLEEEVERMEERVQKQRGELRESLRFERNEELQPQVELPHLQDSGFNKKSNDAGSSLSDPDIEQRGLSPGMTHEGGLFGEVHQTWRDAEQRDITISERSRIGIGESVFGLDQSDSPFELDVRDFGPDVDQNPLFPGMEEIIPDNEWEDSESRSGLW
jgi:hypothetical protein